MSKDGLYTDGAESFGPKVNSIPLSDVDTSKPGETSIGTLVSNATEQISTLVRSEIELAKTELAASAKKGGIGAGLFGVAGVIALYSSFFFFFFLAELLTHLWFDRWAAYLIVFLLMIVIALLSWQQSALAKSRRLRNPRRRLNLSVSSSTWFQVRQPMLWKSATRVFTPKGFLFLSSPPSPIRPLHDFLPRADFCMNHRCRILLPTHSH